MIMTRIQQRAVVLCLFALFISQASQAAATATGNPTVLHRPRLAAAVREWWLSRIQKDSSRVLYSAAIDVLNGDTTTNSTCVTNEFSDDQEEEEEEGDAAKLEKKGDDVREEMRLPLTPWQRLSRPTKRAAVQEEEQEDEAVKDLEHNESFETDQMGMESSALMETSFTKDKHERTERNPNADVTDGSQYSTDQPFDTTEQPRWRQVDRQQVTSALALPTSLSVSSLRSTLKSILGHPQLSKWTLTGMQVGLCFYLLNGIWRAAVEVMDELDVGRDASPHFLKVEQVRQIVNDLVDNSAAPSSLLQQQPTLQHLTQTLLASGMPLRSEAENSIERVLLSLTRSEANLLQQCLWTSTEASSTSFGDICGLNSIKQSLLDLVWTLKGNTAIKKNPFSHLVEHPPGVLLFGPPGCGKTMLVKALASAAQLPCLVVTPSVLFRKYVGDTNLQVRALFSLAQKLSPCILCIDELDGLFRERSSTEHDVNRDLKTEFLQWWDGISSNGRILVVGATNRPFEVDSAVLRRMPQSYFVGLPNYESRRHLLAFLLGSIPVESDLSLHPLASETEGYTPSDLRQVIRMAVTMGPLREARFSQEYRPLSMKDIGQARSIVSPTPLTPGYRAALTEYAQRNSGIAAAPSNNPWDNFYNAGTIHAASHGSSLQEWSDGVDDKNDEDEEYYDENESESDGLD
jgi:adenosinetriphosphatase